jgi:hypothetical protein
MHKMNITAAAALVLGATLITAGSTRADTVIPDDLIVQGSACVGLDCVNNEPFGFDTIRLKENNTRILFFDTSTSVGFPNNQWQLTANDSASGGLNKFSIEDITGAKVPFTIVAAAPTNSMFVASTGKLGLRTATPVLDVHINTGDTPAQRFEQNASSGFTAQTWDVAGNEANFFVRDVTGGSRLPFRIRPGAPTSSIDVGATGSVSMGSASPSFPDGGTGLAISRAGGNTELSMVRSDAATAGSMSLLTGNAQNEIFMTGNRPLLVLTNSAERMRIDGAGNVGIGTASPAAQLHNTGSIRFAAIPNCGSALVTNAAGDLSCLTSSRQFKIIDGALSPAAALRNVMALQPRVGSYKAVPETSEHWLIAEEVAAVDPALVGFHDGKPYTVKTQNVVADLIVVLQQQQRRIDELERRLAAK